MRNQLPAVAGLPDHLETRTFQQTGQTLPQQQIVLCQGNADPAGRGLRNRHRADTMRTAAVDAGRHSHVVDAEAVAALGVLQLVPKVGGRRGAAVGVGRHRVVDGGADIVGDTEAVKLRGRRGRHPHELGDNLLTAAAFDGSVTGQCTKQGGTQAVDVGGGGGALASEHLRCCVGG